MLRNTKKDSTILHPKYKTTSVHELKTMNETTNLIPKKPRKNYRKLKKNNTIIEDIEYIRNTIKEIKEHIEEITVNLSEITNNKSFISHGISKDKHFNLPVKTVRELEDLNEKAGEDEEKYNELFQKIVTFSGGSIEKSLRHIITSELALQYNYKGLKRRLSFQSLKYINFCLYNAVKSECTFEDYTKSVVLGLRRMKNLHFKQEKLKTKEDTFLNVKIKEEFVESP